MSELPLPVRSSTLFFKQNSTQSNSLTLPKGNVANILNGCQIFKAVPQVVF